jgi:hypothetical protein
MKAAGLAPAAFLLAGAIRRRHPETFMQDKCGADARCELG